MLGSTLHRGDRTMERTWPLAQNGPQLIECGMFEGCEESNRETQKRKHQVGLGKPGSIPGNVTQGLNLKICV